MDDARILQLADGARTPDEAYAALDQIRQAVRAPQTEQTRSPLLERLLRHGMRGSKCNELGIDPRVVDRLCTPTDGGQFTYPPPTCWITTTDALLVAPGAQVTDRVQFTSVAALGGIIVGLMGSVIDNTTGLALAPETISVRLRVNAGGVSGGLLVTNGQVETWLNLGSLLRATSPFSPFLRWVDCRDTIDVVFRSEIAAGGVSVRPQLVFNIAGID